jgi:general secretion pathway protein A
MYEEYFGLKRKPFSLVPDPSYFYMSEGHREGLAHLLYGIQNEGGFVLLTGEVGAGKTTVCRRFLEIIPDDVEVAFILNPKVTARELLATVCDEFRIDYPKNTTSIKVLVTRINDHLLHIHESGRRAVIIIEEAQNLDAAVLEQIRLLTNLETNEKKLLQMIMLGQPELRKILLQSKFRQLSQRITARYHLGPLQKHEVAKYVEHRLAAAGLVRGKLFPRRTTDKLVRITGGVPRLINAVCDRALLGTYVQEKNRVDVKTLKRAAREVFGEEGYRGRRLLKYRYAAFAFLFLLLMAFGVFYREPLTKMAVKVSAITYQKGTKKKAEPARASGTDSTVSRPASTSGGTGSFPAGLEHAVGTLERPGGQSSSETKESAYRALFTQWRLDQPPGRSVALCDAARPKGLVCLAGKGGMADLLQINKPAVLTLFDERGDRYYATLTAIGKETATFWIGAETRKVPLKEIARWWAGDYLLLWRRPADYRGGLRPGARGGMVDWLADRLATWSRRAAPPDKGGAYDRLMAEQVKQFQLAHGIVPDGIVGPRTIIGLTGVLPDGDPVLSIPQGGR